MDSASESDPHSRAAASSERPLRRAVEYDRYGPPGVLQVRHVKRPQPKPGDVLVQVDASSVNPIDTVVRAGELRLITGKLFPKRIGIDFAGQVVAIEPGTSEFEVGDRVWGVMPLSVERGVGQGSAAICHRLDDPSFS